MKQICTLFIILLLIAQNIKAQSSSKHDAGQVLDATVVESKGIDNFFNAAPISDEVFRRIWLKSFKRDCTTKREELRYLRVLHANREGKPQVGELICHKAIAEDLLQIFKELYLNGYRIEKMLLVDNYNADDEASMADNNTSCFNFRRVAGSKTLSRHSLGLAIDINPLYNPCLYTRSGKVSPANGKTYAHNRAGIKSCPFPVIDRSDLCYRLFTEHGFNWGGGWRYTKDYQHFEKAPK